MIGNLMNKRTTSVPSMPSSPSSSSPFYQQQVDAQAQPQPIMSRNRGNNVAPPGSEQTHWFEPSPQFAGNRYNADGSGGQYSSYSDYDHALDQRTKQMYKESHEGGGKNVHYK